MRSVFIYLKEPKTSSLVSYLDSICTRRNGPNEAWLCETNNDPVLYVEFYEKEYWNEIEPKDWDELVKKLGSEPKESICVDVSGRHSGEQELFEFLNSFLSKYQGVVLDDYTGYSWNIDEILSGKLIQGHPFFDYLGWYDENQS